MRPVTYAGAVPAMLIREALSSTRMDRDETINLGPPTPHGENVTAERDYAVAPGEYITEWLEENKVSHAELEYALGVSESYVTELISGKMPVSPSIAIQLENLTGIPVKSWTELDRKYWQDRERIARMESIEQQRALEGSLPARVVEGIQAAKDGTFKGVEFDWEQDSPEVPVDEK